MLCIEANNNESNQLPGWIGLGIDTDIFRDGQNCLIFSLLGDFRGLNNYDKYLIIYKMCIK